MSDLISREELLKQIETDSKGHEGQYGDEWLFIDTINSLPTAEPKVGRWKQNKRDVAGEGFFICSCCGNDVYDATDYCPNCGAKMERRIGERKKITIERNICPKPECGDEFPIPKEGWKGASDGNTDQGH